MKSDNLIQLSGFLTKDVITNKKKSFAAFTIGRKATADTPTAPLGTLYSKAPTSTLTASVT